MNSSQMRGEILALEKEIKVYELKILELKHKIYNLREEAYVKFRQEEQA
jgi:hypothetical protein